MKYLLRAAIISIPVVILTSIAYCALELYPMEKTNKLADLLVESQKGSYDRYSQPKSNPYAFGLGSVLYFNIHAHGKDGEFIGAGSYTPDHYYVDFRSLIAKKPEYAYKAWDMFGESFIKRYNDGLVQMNKDRIEELQNETVRVDSTFRYLRKYRYERDANGKSIRIKLNKPIPVYLIENYIQEGDYNYDRSGEHIVITYPIGPTLDSVSNFSIERYWKEQKAVINRYTELMDNLLELDETVLNSYMSEIDEQFSDHAYGEPYGKIHKWMVAKNLISEPSEDRYSRDDPDSWSFHTYPCDLLFLAVRVKKDYPKKWKYDRFFEEVRSFILYVEKDLP